MKTMPIQFSSEILIASMQFTLLDEPARIRDPEYLLLGLLTLLVGALLMLSLRRRMVMVEKLVHPRLSERMMPRFSATRPYARLGLSIAGIFLLTFALARPECGVGVETYQRTGIDLVVVLDASRSMLANDVSPTRFDRAVMELSALLEELSGDRFGLVVFAGTPIVQTPMTTDRRAASMYLRAAHPDNMPRQGTNIGAALRTAHRMLKDSKSPSRVVVLISDGEDHHGDAREMARRLANEDIVIFTVGIGTEEGELISLDPRSPGKGKVHRDRRGEPVLTRLDEALMQDIAKIGNGLYVNTQGRGIGISEVMHSIRGMEQDERDIVEVVRFSDQSSWFLFAGFFLLLTGSVLRPGAKGRRDGKDSRVAVGNGASGNFGNGIADKSVNKTNKKTRGRTRNNAAGRAGNKSGGKISGKKRSAAITGILLLLFSIPFEAEARRLLQSEHPSIARGNEAYAEGRYDEALDYYESALDESLDAESRAVVHYNRGTALAATGRVEAAKSAFDASIALGSPQRHARDYYNLGTALLMAGDYEPAVDALVESLRKEPGNRAAQHNLELALRALQTPPPEEGPESESPEEDESDPEDQEDETEQEQQQDDSDDGDEEEEREEDQQREDDGDEGEEDETESSENGEDEQDQDKEEEKEEGEGEDDQKEPEREDGDEDESDGQEEEKDNGGPDDERTEDEQETDLESMMTSEEDVDDDEQEGRAAALPTEIDEQEIEAILDALEARERPLQPFLFRPPTEMDTAAPDGEDW